MKEVLEEKVQEPILHGFLLGNGMFVTPAEMNIMESFGILGKKKSNSKSETKIKI